MLLLLRAVYRRAGTTALSATTTINAPVARVRGHCDDRPRRVVRRGGTRATPSRRIPRRADFAVARFSRIAGRIAGGERKSEEKKKKNPRRVIARAVFREKRFFRTTIYFFFDIING